MRARNLKPDFFKDEDLGDQPIVNRFVFAGLWCMADRAGRLKDSPRRIKAEVLPYDDADMDAILAQLHEAGFIVRYEVAGERFISVPKFLKHQHPHVAEPASTIPAPESHQSRTVQAPESHGAKTSDPLFLDPLVLIPDSLTGGVGVAEGPAPESQETAPPKASPTKKGSRLPEDFEVTDEMREWARTRAPTVDIDLEVERFCDHFRAAPGQRGLKLDWVATWRNWMRTAKERGNGAYRNGSGGSGVPPRGTSQARHL